MRASSVVGRVAALVALVVAILAVVLLLGGGDDYEVTAEFENAGQLVKGNEVVVGGSAVGTVSRIELGDDGQALVTFNVDENYAPLQRGTVATIRSPSLSQIAGRQVQLTLPPSSEDTDPIDDGGTLSQAETVSAVDLDQLFNTLDPKTRKGLQNVIQGQATYFGGRSEEYAEALKYTPPALNTTSALTRQLVADDAVFDRFLVDTSRAMGAIAERRGDLTSLVSNANTAAGAIADEIRERITEELDYELEASNQRAIARVYRGHPFAVVPEVVTSLCRERVIVSDFVDGRRFGEVRDEPVAERDRLGEILVRFYLNGPLRHRLLNGDPHPGNALFLADGRVAFLDFGFVKRMSDVDVEQLVSSTRATYAGDAQGLLDVVTALGALPADPGLAEPFLENYDAIFGWLMAEQPLTIDSTPTADMLRRYNAMRTSGVVDGLTLPAEHFVLIRAVMLLLGLLGQLRATNTWLDIAREWLFDAEPVTDLGLLEAEFFGDRRSPVEGARA